MNVKTQPLVTKTKVTGLRMAKAADDVATLTSLESRLLFKLLYYKTVRSILAGRWRLAFIVFGANFILGLPTYIYAILEAVSGKIEYLWEGTCSIRSYTGIGLHIGSIFNFAFLIYVFISTRGITDAFFLKYELKIVGAVVLLQQKHGRLSDEHIIY